MARAIDEPIRPIPMKATRPNSGPPPENAGEATSNSLDMPSALQECRNRVHHSPHLLFGADGDPQAVGQTVAAHLAHQDTSGLQELACGLGGLISIR